MREPIDPVTQIHRYFEHLEAGNFEEAVACFSKDAFYSHPPYRWELPSSGRHEATGHAELLSLFQRRGKRDSHHEYNTYVVGDRGFVSGTSITGAGSAGSFISEFTVDADGLLSLYVTYVSIPPVGAATP